MFVENKELYHFNNNENYSNIWQVGNEIDNTENYISNYYKKTLYFSANVPTTPDDKMVHFSRIIEDY